MRTMQREDFDAAAKEAFTLADYWFKDHSAQLPAMLVEFQFNDKHDITKVGVLFVHELFAEELGNTGKDVVSAAMGAMLRINNVVCLISEAWYVTNIDVPEGMQVCEMPERKECVQVLLRSIDATYATRFEITQNPRAITFQPIDYKWKCLGGRFTGEKRAVH